MKLGDVEKRLEMAWRYRVGDGTHEPITLHLLGPGGVGKSTITKTWSRKKAAELGLMWVDYDTLDAESAERIAQPGEREKHYVYADVRVTQLDPVDLMGLPRQVGSRARFLPLDLATLFERGHGLLVLDEFSDEERPNMQAALKKVVRDYRFGATALSPHTLIVAISNTVETSATAHPLPKPLRDRFDFVEVDPPTVKEWIQYMDENYPGEVGPQSGRIPRLEAKRHTRPRRGGGRRRPHTPATPRGWTYVALSLPQCGGDRELVESLTLGKLGPTGASLAAFLAVKTPIFEEIVEDPSIISGYTVEGKVLTAMVVAENLADKRADRVLEYLIDRDDRETAALIFKLTKKKNYMAFSDRVARNSKIMEFMQRLGRDIM
ncbi:hypothetical protein B9Q03_10535 [Candidatus Marsarchaeota G2 archaeon OSP_D]|uniref:AAA+ ATPase domain-containing protein n=1 Tax=Candidatus Marsarchaeota G2 archaeon OSP_D TaxID=1978157 RepID=A0A2R6AM64_9ARCH|nr:MAG: hypothetical protein B9Q03_10535 [Candidatus Marsarchaeota G2 archaeon OSP_D]